MNLWAMTSESVTEHMCRRIMAIRSGVKQAAPKSKSGPAVPSSTRGTVAIISVRGVLMRDAIEEFGEVDTMGVAHQLRYARGLPEIDGVVMVLDTPGGSVLGLSEVVDEMRSLASVKPLAVQVQGLCCSAGMYIASAAPFVYAGRTDMVGSIGTINYYFDYTKFLDEIGFKAVVAATSEIKTLGLPGVAASDTHKAELQRLVDGYFADFKAQMIAGRGAKMKPDALEKYFDARCVLATEAAKDGLIDGIASLDQTVEKVSVWGGKLKEAASRRVA